VLLELLGLLEVQVVTEEVQPLVLRSDYLQVAVAVGVVDLFQQVLGQVVEEGEQQLQP
jgi:predicted nuclease of restriction endonuclease-like RecB superfamily